MSCQYKNLNNHMVTYPNMIEKGEIDDKCCA